MKTTNNDAAFIADANVLEEALRYEEALKKYDEGIVSCPNSAWLQARKGRCLILLERHQEAIRALTAALALKLEAPTTLFNRAQAYEKIGDLRAALLDYQKSAELKPKADVFMNIGLIFRYQGNLEAAANAYKTALTLDPENRTVANLLQDLSS